MGAPHHVRRRRHGRGGEEQQQASYPAERVDGDAVGLPDVKGEAEPLYSEHERRLVGRGGLIHNLFGVDAIALRHDCVTDGQQREPLAASESA